MVIAIIIVRSMHRHLPKLDTGMPLPPVAGLAELLKKSQLGFRRHMRAILELQEKGTIQMLYNKWWKNTGDVCTRQVGCILWSVQV